MGPRIMSWGGQALTAQGWAEQCRQEAPRGLQRTGSKAQEGWPGAITHPPTRLALIQRARRLSPRSALTVPSLLHTDRLFVSQFPASIVPPSDRSPRPTPWLFPDPSLVSFSLAVCNQLSLLGPTPSPPAPPRTQGRGGQPFSLPLLTQSLALAGDTAKCSVRLLDG